jgi:hypothetical protein
MTLNEYALLQGRKSILYSSHDAGINDSLVSQQPANEHIKITQSPKDRRSTVGGKRSIKVNEAFRASRTDSINDYLCGSFDQESKQSKMNKTRFSERSVDGRTSTEPTRTLKSS